MSAGFSQTMRSLTSDGARRSLAALLLAVALLVGWTYWFFRARVAVTEVAEGARLEVDGAVHALQAPVAGRVARTNLALGRHVEAGEVLVELEMDAQQLQLQEERTRLEVLGPQLAALRRELLAEERATEQQRHGMRAALSEARAQYREAMAAARFAAQQAERLRRLRHNGGVAELEIQRAQAEAQQRRAAAEALVGSISRLRWGNLSEQSGRQARLDQLRRQVAELEGQMATLRAASARLENEIELRRIRAPASGQLGEVAALRNGSVVGAGERLATIVPQGELRIVAEFPAQTALGRIRPGQPARLRLDGFPWTQFGTVQATVTNVGSEAREGRVRVELRPRRNPNSVIPLQHGLPGSVEIDVDRVSPAALVIRGTGKLLATSRRWTAVPQAASEGRE